MTFIDHERGQTIAYRFTEELWNKGNAAVAEQLLAENFVDHDPVSGQAPGRDGYQAMVSAFRAAFPDLRVANEDVILSEDGRKVALRWTAQGTHLGALTHIPATGRSVSLKGIDILLIRDGTVSERWGEFDTLGMLQQLGVIPK